MSDFYFEISRRQLAKLEDGNDKFDFPAGMKVSRRRRGCNVTSSSIAEDEAIEEFLDVNRIPWQKDEDDEFGTMGKMNKMPKADMSDNKMTRLPKDEFVVGKMEKMESWKNEATLRRDR